MGTIGKRGPIFFYLCHYIIPNTQLSDCVLFKNTKAFKYLGSFSKIDILETLFAKIGTRTSKSKIKMFLNNQREIKCAI